MTLLHKILTPAALALALPAVAMAQTAQPLPVVAPGSTVLTVTGEGRVARTPDLAQFSAGVTTQGETAAAAMSANAAQMNRVLAALKAAGVADKDVQTSQISLNPVYGDQSDGPDGTVRALRIMAYQATNRVSITQREVRLYGKVLDALVAAGANEVNGPAFQLDNPEAALDEARVAAITAARKRADLYAKAAGLRVVRMLTISESGGYAPPPPVMFARAAMASDAAPTPVASGQIELTANVTVQFELAR